MKAVIDMSEHVADIEHQLWINSCGAHAGTTALEMLLSMSGKQVELDRLFTYYVLRDMAGYGDKDNGSRIRDIPKALKEIGIADGRTFDRAQLDKAEQELKRQYLTRGKYGVVITTTVTPLERNRVGINFNIEEGDAAKIRQINIVGAKAFSEKDLLSQFQLTTPGWMTWYTKNDQYSRQKLSADLEKLKSFYMNQGYLEFAVESTQVSISPDKQDVYITVNVTEGDRYQVSSVKLAGDLADGLLGPLQPVFFD